MMQAEKNKIRMLSAGEIPLVARWAGAFHEKSASVSIDPPVFIRHWHQIFAVGAGVIFATSSLDGFIGGYIMHDPLDGVLTATEAFWFVGPKSRGSGIRLFSAFEAWALRQKCKRITMVHLMDSSPETLSRLYRRRGYVPLEMHYRKDLV
jgi:GNAT superfamily N-acetyltransferase